MHYSLLLTLACTIYLLILILIYFSKKNLVYLKCKIYKTLLLFTLFMSIFEFVTIKLISTENYNNIGIELFNIRWFMPLIWSMLIHIYMVVANKPDRNVKLKNLLEEKRFIISLVFLSILLVGFFFIPYNSVTPDNIVFISGARSYYSVVFIIICFIITLIYIIKAKYKTKDSITTIIFFAFCGILSLILQIIYPNIDVISTTLILLLFVIYITLENPTLDLIDDLKVIKRNIDTSSKIKTDVLLSMSHDIRSPMNAIVNYGKNISELTDKNEKNIDSDINNVIVSGKNLLNIIGDVLDITSNKNQDIVSNVGNETYKLSSIMNDLLNITKSRIGEKHIKLECEISDNVPKVLKGNPTKLYRIIMNVLSNSAKYTEVGRIKISVSANIDDNSDDVMLLFKVYDTGFGIKDEDKNKIFSEYGRLKDATNQNIEGTGLGLVNTKINVENLGGRIWFESTYGACTTFYIEIPQKISNEQMVSEETKNIKDKKQLLNCKGLKALIVDDNKLNAYVITKLLERYGFKVSNSIDGEECIDRIKQGKHYDIIFMDISLRGIDGIETMKILKQLNKMFEIPPIIALTTNVAIGARNMYLSKGFDEYVSKPIDLYDLDRVINLYFGNKMF